VQEADNEALTLSWEEAIAYNEILWSRVYTDNEFSKETLRDAAKDYWAQLNPGENGIIGYVRIPKIEVMLPIYHGTDVGVLEQGVGHLLGTSLPVGGDSTHTVLTAHSGMASQKMFSDLPQMEVGDVFYIEVLDQVLAYQVDQIATVLPHETEHLKIEEAQDHCTLVTCTPFGINTHRLLVRGTRIPYEEEQMILIQEERQLPHVSTWEGAYIKGVLLGGAIAAVLLLVVLVIGIYRRHRREKN
jgi:sortase A